MNRPVTASAVSLRRRAAFRARAWLGGGLCTRILLVCVFAGSFFGAPLQGQEIALPEDQQLSLFARVLPFDRHFVERVGDEVTIGVLYQSGFRESLRVKDAIVDAAARGLPAIAHVPTRFVPLDVPTVDALTAAFAAHEIDVLYVAPMRSIALTAVSAFCLQHQIPCITGVPDYVEAGIAVGIDERGGKPEILVNQTSAEAAGMDFNARFLRLVTIR